MNILILTNEYPPHIYGGAGVHVDHLVREMERCNGGCHRIQVLCFGNHLHLNAGVFFQFGQQHIKQTGGLGARGNPFARNLEGSY